MRKVRSGQMSEVLWKVSGPILAWREGVGA